MIPSEEILMKSTETKSAEIILLTQEATQTGEADHPSRNTSYARSSQNALKHGILSRHTVLPHECEQEYQSLLAALVKEHGPSGATEEHLVEELAGIIWRKQRLRLAEGAAFYKGMRDTVAGYGNDPVQNALPLHGGLSREGVDFLEVITAEPDAVKQSLLEAQADLERTERAAGILRKGGANCYRRALKALREDSREGWEEELQAGHYEATPEGLLDYLKNEVLPLVRRIVVELSHYEAIKRQTLGEALQVKPLEVLARYESHLDRKLERMLAMLIKLKELRSRPSRARTA
jgi:hypothetical protein